MTLLFMLLASGLSQGSPEYYIASLQMPCYPPLARQARVQGQTKVRVEVGHDGEVTVAEALDGNPLSRPHLFRMLEHGNSLADRVLIYPN